MWASPAFRIHIACVTGCARERVCDGESVCGCVCLCVSASLCVYVCVWMCVNDLNE